MTASTARMRHEPQQTPMLVYGLALGPGVGMLVALLSGGPEAIPLGLVSGAGAGVVCGALLDHELARRRNKTTLSQERAST